MSLIKTQFGSLSANIKTTYHVSWLTYAFNRQNGSVGLEDIVKGAYGKDIEMGSSNDTDYSVDIKKEELSKYELDDLEQILKHGFFEDHHLRLIMTDLANKDIIPEGSYVVNMSW